MSILQKPWAKALFAASGLAVAALLSLRGDVPYRIAGLLCALAVLILLAFRLGFLESAFCHGGRAATIFALVLAPLASHRLAADLIRTLPQVSDKWISLVPIGGRTLFAVLLALAALPAAFVYLRWFAGRVLPAAKGWLARADRAETIFFAAAGTLLAVWLTAVFLSTTVFYDTRPGGYAIYDVVYTTDSSVLMDTDTYQRVNAKENDIRHPLFGLFSMPLGLLAGAAARLLFFVPNAYAIVIGILQIAPLLCGWIMLARMLGLTGAGKAFFLTASVLTFPALLYTLSMERYTLTFFWLMVLLYAWFFRSGERNLPFIAATGATLTTGVLFPLLTDAKDWRGRVRDIARCAIQFFAIAALFGQLPLFLNTVPSLSALTRFAGGGVGFTDRLHQYLRFIASCFIAPPSGLETESVTAWRQLPVTSVSILGIVVLAGAAAGFIVCRRNRFARVCAAWIAFSLVLLLGAGWGTAENGLALYTLYFSWAYLSLLVLLTERLLARWKALRTALYACAAAAMAAVNLPALGALIRFGIQHYPAG